MAISFADFLAMIADSLSTHQGPHLAYLLRPTSPHGKDLIKEFRNPTRESLGRYAGAIASPWDEISIQYVLVVNALVQNRPSDAFKEQSQLVSLFFRAFTNDTGWTLSALFAILRDLRDVAQEADIASEKTLCTEEAARVISRAFTNCVTDRTSPPSESRKWGVYYIVGLIMKCYFRIRTLGLCRNILRALEANTDIPPLSAYPRAHQVTFRYYLGTLMFLNEDYEKAEHALTLAFYHCHASSNRNQQRILTYLIPLRILRGHLPSPELLSRFPVLQDIYQPFLDAIRKSDVRAYDAALTSMEHRLLELNVWLILEKARELALRGLFRKVWIVSDRNTRIPLNMFHAAVRVIGMKVELEEVECYVANMIYRGLIKGYISHEKQTVVLAARDAFPRVADRKTPWIM